MLPLRAWIRCDDTYVLMVLKTDYHKNEWRAQGEVVLRRVTEEARPGWATISFTDNGPRFLGTRSTKEDAWKVLEDLVLADGAVAVGGEQKDVGRGPRDEGD
jgi:hypothetical protein